VAQKSKLLTQYNSLLFWATLYICDLISDNCSDVMLRFQSYLGLGMAGVWIQRNIIGNVFYSTFTNVFILVFYVFNVLKIIFYIYAVQELYTE